MTKIVLKQADRKPSTPLAGVCGVSRIHRWLLCISLPPFTLSGFQMSPIFWVSSYIPTALPASRPHSEVVRDTPACPRHTFRKQV